MAERSRRRIRLGMVGGGRGAFIGAVHRMAACLDGQATLVAGALSSRPAEAVRSALEWDIEPGRAYPTWREMLEREAALPPEARLDAVVIVTPNATHLEIAAAFAGAGFGVIIDKPMVTTRAEAAELAAAVTGSGVLCAVTFTYTGYPMLREAARLARSGSLGTIRKVFVEYHQGWLATPLETTGHKQAAWRTDPALAGPAGALGDIGSHAQNLVEMVTGLEIGSVCADVAVLVPGRRLDDDAGVLLRLTGGARGVLTCSQVCAGEENELGLRVYGSEGGLRWTHARPDELTIMSVRGERTIVTRGGTGVGPGPRSLTRLPGGHPEGFIEALANIYRAVFAALREGRTAPGEGPDGPEGLWFPSLAEGARSVRFTEAVLESARHEGAWVDVGRSHRAS
ncbi:MAG TPA: Gfo/Idh/MocA family oxidoreductase [Phycisphaerales bacterium]|nr:Gfo/Idh/MocA family oxidoreductase [Phycisphaerales bacterium]